MRISNPYALPPAPIVSAADKETLHDALRALAAVNAPDAEQVRAALPEASRERFTDAFICQVALDLGLAVSE
jgi:hypothetical protein